MQVKLLASNAIIQALQEQFSKKIIEKKLNNVFTSKDISTTIEILNYNELKRSKKIETGQDIDEVIRKYIFYYFTFAKETTSYNFFEGTAVFIHAASKLAKNNSELTLSLLNESVKYILLKACEEKIPNKEFLDLVQPLVQLPTPIPILCIASASSRFNKISFKMIDIGMNVNCYDYNILTPLHYAAMTNNNELLLKLIQFGANILADDILLCTPLHYAAKYSHLECAYQLIANNQNAVRVKDINNSTALHYLARNFYKINNKSLCKDVIKEIFYIDKNILKKEFNKLLNFSVFKEKIPAIIDGNWHIFLQKNSLYWQVDDFGLNPNDYFKTKEEDCDNKEDLSEHILEIETEYTMSIIEEDT